VAEESEPEEVFAVVTEEVAALFARLRRDAIRARPARVIVGRALGRDRNPIGIALGPR
jgi:hypothetical protein